MFQWFRNIFKSKREKNLISCILPGIRSIASEYGCSVKTDFAHVIITFREDSFVILNTSLAKMADWGNYSDITTLVRLACKKLTKQERKKP